MIKIGKKKNLPTVRREVELGTTNKDSFAEFSYASLKKHENIGNIATSDKKNSRRHDIMEDFIYNGAGYDAEDDFIDDSDACEIFVPPDRDFGGFYVNKGILTYTEKDETEKVSLLAGTRTRNFGDAPPIKVAKIANKVKVTKKDSSKGLVNNLYGSWSSSESE